MSAEYADAMQKAGTPEKIDLEPIGTGPFQLVNYQKDAVIRYKANPDFWGTPAKIDNLVFAITPDASVRYQKLKAGECQVMAYPNPADLPAMAQDPAVNLLKQEGLNIGYLAYNTQKKPLDDQRVRKALNMAVNKTAIIDSVFQGAGTAAKNPIPPTIWSYNDAIKDDPYDPEAAKKLLAEAGFGPDKPVKIKMLISASGSGQMLPLQMNEYMQQNLKAVGIDVDFEVVEWQALLDLWRAGGKSPQIKGAHGVNISYTTQDPYSAFTRLMRSDLAAPVGVNFGYYSDPEMDKLLNEAQVTFDAKARDEVLAKIHAKMVDDALFLWVVHDVAPRAISPKVKGFVQVRNWFHSLSGVTMTK
jgi:dipeptide transport system substrate-binding protein